MRWLLVLAGHGGDVEHRAVTGRLHVRGGELGQPEQREDVEVVGPAEVVHGHVEGLRPAAAGIVDEDGQAARRSRWPRPPRLRAARAW